MSAATRCLLGTRPFAGRWTSPPTRFSHGSPYFGAEVRLEEGNKLLGRYVVSAGASPLKD